MSDVLSKPKKSQMIVWAGASLLKVKRLKKPKRDKDRDEERKERVVTKRGKIVSFSRFARSGMMNMIARIRVDELPCFVTLTYPKVYSDDCEVWKIHLNSFVKRLNRAFPTVSGIWKLEPQKRGAPHYHLLVWGVSCEELCAFVPEAWHEVIGSDDPAHLAWHRGECGNGNIHCVQEVTTAKSMYKYVVKYVAKSVLEGWKYVGKWWGVFYKSRLPVGEEVVFEITEEKAMEIMRYMRRYARIRSRNYSSLSVICDANHWMEKIQAQPMGTYREWLERLSKDGLSE